MFMFHILGILYNKIARVLDFCRRLTLCWWGFNLIMNPNLDRSHRSDKDNGRALVNLMNEKCS